MDVMSKEATAQLNIRMSRVTKAAGDATLAEAGVSATDFIRAIWTKIGRGLADLRQVQEALLTPASQANTDEVNTDDALDNIVGRKQQAIARGRALYADGLASLGVTSEHLAYDRRVPSGVLSDRDLYVLAMEERMRERGML